MTPDEIERVYDDYLYDCYLANKRLTPEDWAWYGKEEHHVEIPARDNGVLTPLNSQYLTQYQHWVAGVLQSEVLQKLCFAFIPAGVLPGKLESMRLKWSQHNAQESIKTGRSCFSPEWHQQPWVTEYKRETGLRAVKEQTGVHAPGFRDSEESRERSRQTALRNVELGLGIHSLSPEEKSEIMKNYFNQLTPQERSDHGKKAWEGLSPDEKSDVGKKSAQTVRDTYTPEQMRERNRKIARARSPRPIILTTPSGEEIYYELLYDACVEHGLQSPKLGSVCRGERKTHRGFTARYAD
jgi:hypothetical protein